MHPKKLLSIGFVALLLTSMAVVVGADPWDGVVDDPHPKDEIWVDPLNTTGLRAGDTFVVDVLVNVTNLYAFEYKLFWNSSVINAVSIQIHIPPGWTDYMIVKNETGVWSGGPQDGRDYHWLAIAAMAPSTPWTCCTSLCTYKFDVQWHAYICEKLDIQDDKLVDDTATLIPHTTDDGMYCIPLVHEIQAINMWPSIWLNYDWWWMDTIDSKVIRGEWLWILCTCVNMGTVTDTFNVTLTAHHVATDTTIALPWEWYENEITTPWNETNVMVTLEPHSGSGWYLMFTWHTDTALPGVWELTLMATPVPGESDITNNNMSYSIEILPYGELSQSLLELISRPPSLTGVINIEDVVIAALAFGSTPSDPNWNHLADFNNDGKINIIDLVVIGVNFGKTWN